MVPTALLWCCAAASWRYPAAGAALRVPTAGRALPLRCGIDDSDREPEALELAALALPVVACG
eukprot:5774884-Prymnesium_polylepis.1